MNYTKHYNTRKPQTPQSEQASPKQKQNNAGGFSFELDKWGKLQRFLILGTEGGTYYVGERKLTIQNATNLEACIKEDGRRVVDTIVEISDAGRAPQNDSALFALAMASAADDAATRKYALAALPKVARIGTHLFQFAGYVEGFRGWGRALRNAVANWYQTKNADQLGYQLVKYQQRNGWSHRDLLRLSHPKATDARKDALYAWAVGKESEVSGIVEGFELAKRAEASKEIVTLIKDYNLPREAIPTQHLNDVAVWDALLYNMPLNAMIRNLGKMTSIGLLAQGSDAAKLVAMRLADAEYLKKSRVHPMSVLTALKVYQNGGGFRGKLTWNPVQRIVDGLDQAFYASFGNVEPTGKSILIGLDVSGSMGSNINGSEVLSCAEASTAMCLITAKTESDVEVMAFSDKFVPVDFGKFTRLDDALKKTRGMNFGGTDCSLPMQFARGYSGQNSGWYSRASGYKKTHNLTKYDAFIVYTDNETLAGAVHPHQSLNLYRQESGIPAKLAVVGMATIEFSIANPDDAGMLDVVGFDTATPNILSDFIRG